MAIARCGYAEVAASGYVERPREAAGRPWVERYLDRSGGWRLAPRAARRATGGSPAAGRAGADPAAPGPQARTPRLDFLGEPAAVILHPDDARRTGRARRQPVEVGAPAGGRRAHTAVAKVDPGIRRGVVSVPHGHHSANVNALTDKDELDPVTGMVRYSAVPVALRTPPRSRARHSGGTAGCLVGMEEAAPKATSASRARTARAARRPLIRACSFSSITAWAVSSGTPASSSA